MIVTRKAIPRRAILRGLGATLTLPLLDAMVPAFGRLSAATRTSRLSTIYIGNGANMKTWTPTAEGAAYEMTPMLEPLAAFRDRMLVVSGLDNKPGLALPGEPAGGHGRIGGSFLTGVHVKPTEGADFQAGISIDQIAARELGRHTELASLELSLDTTEFAGACDAGFSCAYTTTLCWRGPTSPVPMEHDPRAVFERLFGDSGSTNRADRLSRLTSNRSILDSVMTKLARLQRDLGARDREKLSQYVESIRDVERRIQRAEEQSARELPVVEQPAGAPDSFEAYARLMFDLQVLALQSDLTRVTTFMLASELSARTYPEAGVPDPHHAISHHQGRADNLEKIGKIGVYHSKTAAYYLERLQSTPDGDGSLLDHTSVILGRGMSDSNAHQPIDLPIAVFSRELGGGSHVRRKGVPLTNLYMTVLANLGVPVEQIGDSTGRLAEL
jgi:hypothetical protein